MTRQRHVTFCGCRSQASTFMAPLSSSSLLLLLLLITGAPAKHVKLEILPRDVVEQGHDATLVCDYELDGAKLYSLKWYRGNNEIYRYSPDEKEPIKIFNFPWIKIDRQNSTMKQVVIRDADFHLTGNFSCEATADAPYFYTQASSRQLTVVSVPKDKPVIMSENAHYKVGDTLKANCSTTPSKPPVKLSFLLNGVSIGDAVTQQQHQSQEKQDRSSLTAGGGRSAHQGRQWSEISLQLQAWHFSSNGQLNLRCIAKIPNIYEQESETLHLGAEPGREPMPARVRSEIASNNSHRIADLTIVALIALHLRLR